MAGGNLRRRIVLTDEKEAATDIVWLKTVARKLLLKLQEALGGDLSAGSALQDAIFGKGSLVSALVTLADLLLRLHEAEQGIEAIKEVAEPVFSEGDVALIKAFVCKMQHMENV